MLTMPLHMERVGFHGRQFKTKFAFKHINSLSEGTNNLELTKPKHFRLNLTKVNLF